MMNLQIIFRRAVFFVVTVWFLLFAVLPFCLIILFSFHFNDLLHLQSMTWDSYQNIWDPLYGKIIIKSLILAIKTTLLAVLIGYPAAYFITQLKKSTQSIALLFLIIPFWTSALIRTYALMTLLKAKGLLNSLLILLGLISVPHQFLFTQSAVLIAMVYTLLPFMILPLYASLSKIDSSTIEAAIDLGASSLQSFWRVIFPQSLSGLAAGMTLVFLPAMTLFYIPVLVGGARDILLGNWLESLVYTAHDLPMACAISVLMGAILILILVICRCFFVKE